MSFRPKLGYLPSPPDYRDYHIRNLIPPRKLPVKFSLRDKMGSIFDQGVYGSCVASSMKNLADYHGLSIKLDSACRFIYSRRSNSPEEGMWPREALDMMLKLGICKEALCKYTAYGALGANDVICESPEILADALNHRIDKYGRIYSISDLKQAIAALGPASIGVNVYSGWFEGATLTNGHIPMPNPGEQSQGGHMITPIGWDDESELIEFENSWYIIPKVQPWGDKGFGWMPYQYFEDDVNSGGGEGWSITGLAPGPGPEPEPKTCLEKFQACKKDTLSCLIDLIFCWLGITATKKQKEVMRKKLMDLGVS